MMTRKKLWRQKIAGEKERRNGGTKTRFCGAAPKFYQLLPSCANFRLIVTFGGRNKVSKTLSRSARYGSLDEDGRMLVCLTSDHPTTAQVVSESYGNYVSPRIRLKYLLPSILYLLNFYSAFSFWLNFRLIGCWLTEPNHTRISRIIFEAIVTDAMAIL